MIDLLAKSSKPLKVSKEVRTFWYATFIHLCIHNYYAQKWGTADTQENKSKIKELKPKKTIRRKSQDLTTKILIYKA